MKTVNVVALILVIIGGLNWLLVGLFQFNLVDTIFGVNSVLSRLIYILVGIAALYCLVLIKPVSEDRTAARRTI